ncbi:MAG: cupredoxin domain-containing protein [Salinibacter sp.]|uniref:cupredoxin domain-containing protein n=1 Tax=Salinibacter sp. TaxID=2065818 RepID=UPI0035D43429
MSRLLIPVPPYTFSRVIVLASLAVVLLACGSDDSQQAAEAESNETASASTDTTAKVIEVTMKDYAYQPSSITVPAGQKVTLKFKNAGTVEHYFVVGDTIAGSKDGFRHNLFSGVSIEKRKQTSGHSEESEKHGEGEEHHANEFELPPGGSGAMTFTLPPAKAGTYTFACFETTGNKKHYEMGMKGTLTVTASTGN